MSCLDHKVVPAIGNSKHIHNAPPVFVLGAESRTSQDAAGSQVWTVFLA